MNDIDQDNSSKRSSGIKKGKRSFAGNAMMLVSGVGAVQVFGILASPIISRLFSPEAFGTAAVITYCIAMLKWISCLRYEVAIVLPEKDEDAAPLVTLCSIILVFVILALSIATWLVAPQILTWLNVSELIPYRWVIPVSVFFFGLRFISRNWNTRHKRFSLVAGERLMTGIPSPLITMVGGLSGFQSGSSLILLRLIAGIIAPIFMFWKMIKDNGRFIVANSNLAGMINAAKRYKKFPLIDSWSVLLHSASFRIATLLIIAYFDKGVGGHYSKALRLLYMPITLIGRSLSQVFFQKSAALIAKGRNINDLVESVVNRMISVGILIFGLIAIVGPDVFNVYLGTRWTESGIFARIVSPWLFMVLIFVPVRSLYGSLEKQGAKLSFTILLFLCRVSVLICCGTMINTGNTVHDARLTLTFFTVVSTLILLWQSVYLIRQSKLSLLRPIFHFFRCVLYISPSIAIVAVSKWLANFNSWILIIITVVSTIPYIFLILRQDDELRKLFMNLVKKVGITR